jgi:hypothetical protein
MKPKFIPVFSGGTGRSGTTLIGKILGKHPRVHAGRPYEIKFLTGRNGLLDLLGDNLNSEQTQKSNVEKFSTFLNSSLRPNVSQKQLTAFHEKITQEWWQRQGKHGGTAGLFQGFDFEDLERKLATLEAEYVTHPVCSTRKFFYDFIASNKYITRAEFVVDTTPTNIERSGQISQFLTNAKFIHMQRDGRDTISSVLREPWGPSDPMKAIQWWKSKVLKAKTATSTLASYSILDISLEDLVGEKKEVTYLTLLKFLELEDAQEMWNYLENEVNSENAHMNRWREDPLLNQHFQKKFQEACNELEDLGLVLSQSID